MTNTKTLDLNEDNENIKEFYANVSYDGYEYDISMSIFLHDESLARHMSCNRFGSIAVRVDENCEIIFARYSEDKTCAWVTYNFTSQLDAIKLGSLIDDIKVAVLEKVKTSAESLKAAQNEFNAVFSSNM